jgi:hypothetical protein
VSGVGQAWREWGLVVAVAAALLPLAAVAVWALTRWRRRRGAPRGPALRRSLAEVGAVVGTAPWLWMVLAPRPGASRVALVPLRDLADVLAGAPGVALAQVGGNLLVFAALGFFAPIRLPALAGSVRLLALGAAGSLAVEAAQYVLDLGRVSAVDDVLLNAAGAALGGLASRRWWAGRAANWPPDHPAKRPGRRPVVDSPATIRQPTGDATGRSSPVP